MKVRELLNNPSKWTQGSNATDANGKDVNPESPKAVCWCLQGAIIRCYGMDSSVHRRVDKHLGECVIDWNDFKNRKFEQVLTLAETLDL